MKCHYPASLLCHITCAEGQGAEPNALVPSGRGAGEMTGMKLLSASVLWLQALLFALGTAYVVWGFIRVVEAGAWFVPGFESIELRRLIATLAPYLVLPVGIISFILALQKWKYGTAASFPLVLVALAVVAGQLYLTAVPDPVMENFGPRPLPYPGFLVLPPEGVPPGFQEVSHHYTKQEYGIRFRKMLNGDPIDLDIIESPTTKFVYDQSKLVREFDHQEVTGRVYAAYNDRSRKTTLNLIWLNPPKQRISIYLTQSVGNDYSPEDLIRVLESMKLAK